MKRHILLITFLSFFCIAQAQQWNPFVSSPHLSASPIDLSKGDQVTLNFNAGNIGITPMTRLDQPLRIIISLSGLLPANQANPAASVSGASFFNISYSSAINSFLLEQNTTIPAALNGGATTISIQARVTSISTQESPQNGFQVNLIPPAYTSTTNNINDDQSSVITYTLNSILPVELVSFEGSISDCKAKLTWLTASELNNDYFSIQKSVDAIHWDELGKVKGNGTTSEPHNYEFVDPNVNSKDSYYRLVQYDFDGTRDFSQIISLNAPNCGGQSYRIYPNPAQDIINIEYQEPIHKQYISNIFSASGQLVKTVMIKDMNNRIFVGDLVPGAYLLNIESADEQSAHTIVIQR